MEVHRTSPWKHRDSKNKQNVTARTRAYSYLGMHFIPTLQSIPFSTTMLIGVNTRPTHRSLRIVAKHAPFSSISHYPTPLQIIPDHPAPSHATVLDHILPKILHHRPHILPYTTVLDLSFLSF